ncbi:PREDICTED: uncharacterized protein LOC105599338 [Cercocebus atys]|uniref:uncharacterized protein LOC105599338 n=1 Tax=Cercocebus atys TaxID=9531 RepID=UPI0005F3BDE8|nr:PREDICTED: uncharacterized protein LOC105599338 [Cercocebus atys]
MLGVVLASLLEGTFECNGVTLPPHSTGDTTRQAHVQGPAVASQWWFAGETSPVACAHGVLRDPADALGSARASAAAFNYAKGLESNMAHSTQEPRRDLSGAGLWNLWLQDPSQNGPSRPVSPTPGCQTGCRSPQPGQLLPGEKARTADPAQAWGQPSWEQHHLLLGISQANWPTPRRLEGCEVSTSEPLEVPENASVGTRGLPWVGTSREAHWVCSAPMMEAQVPGAAPQ